MNGGVTSFNNFDELDDKAKLAVTIQAVQGYHKEKNACKETCTKQGERLGKLEQDDAVQNNNIIDMKQDIRDMRVMLNGIQKTVATITGIGIAINTCIVVAGMFLKG